MSEFKRMVRRAVAEFVLRNALRHLTGSDEGTLDAHLLIVGRLEELGR
jgi:hypothetical protein